MSLIVFLMIYLSKIRYETSKQEVSIINYLNTVANNALKNIQEFTKILVSKKLR